MFKKPLGGHPNPPPIRTGRVNLRKMSFSANFPSYYTNVNISQEFGNATRKRQSNFEAEESSFTATSLLSLKINRSWL